MIPQNNNVHQLVWHLYVDTAVEDNELYYYNPEGDRNSVVSQASWRMGWALLELQAKTGIGKRTIHKILREDLHFREIASKWVPHALTEVEKWTRYAVPSFTFFFFLFKIRIINTFKSN